MHVYVPFVLHGWNWILYNSNCNFSLYHNVLDIIYNFYTVYIPALGLVVAVLGAVLNEYEDTCSLAAKIHNIYSP